ncbi:MAG: hypothetical protein H6765_03585 [Candidatus Peribacteria bacterium]|nr:MAG: hypothetical protein H6765_03585 [Candidatus Peribacteria bacterium]
MYYGLDDLIEEMQKYPDLFTYDLKFFLEHYRKDIESFKELIKRSLGDL